jgi:mono/diheme cytochrome c family protein
MMQMLKDGGPQDVGYGSRTWRDEMLKPFFIVLALTGAFIGAIVPQESPTGSASPSASVSAGQARAKTIYARDCAMCHGDNGNGQTDMAKSMTLVLPDWTDPASLAGRQDHDLLVLIRKGKGKMLPEGEDRASDEDIRNVILYIRAFSQSKPASGASR